MTATFFAQYAAGCLLIVPLVPLRTAGWKYGRLMALVSLGLAFLALLLVIREPKLWDDALLRAAGIGLAAGLVTTIAWLAVNAAQADAPGGMQATLPAAGGLACLVASIALAMRPDESLPAPHAVVPEASAAAAAIAATTTLGALLLGTATCAMLLGHRYLTDTDLPIAPLRRLTRVYLGTVLARIAWVAFMAAPLWSGKLQPAGDRSWFWVVLGVRAGIGLIATAVFAYLIWDCVRHRATQSATALFYLSMVFVFLGELTGQYLTRTQALAF